MIKVKMIGYVQLYFKIVGAKETYYLAFDGDFGKPLTWFRLRNIKRSMRKLYGKIDRIYSVEFFSKEVYAERSQNVLKDVQRIPAIDVQRQQASKIYVG